MRELLPMWGRAFGFVALSVGEWQALENRCCAIYLCCLRSFVGICLKPLRMHSSVHGLVMRCIVNTLELWQVLMSYTLLPQRVKRILHT